jgi:GNAT superfamily N-acetyltransferase
MLGVNSVSSYRFCRTDDIGLLVDALNHCWAPYFPDEPSMTPEAFKRSIRDLQIWCSSCMVAFSGSDPIGVLIGAKRPSGTLIHKIAVHPNHRRQGHARHLLTSLSSKLAILGPARIVAEVPEALAPACDLFRGCGYVQEAVMTDYVLQPEEHEALGTDLVPCDQTQEFAPVYQLEPEPSSIGWMIPATVDDLAANGLLDDAERRVCWERSVETLTARKDDLRGLAIASDEGIESYVLSASPNAAVAEIVSLRTFVEHGGGHLTQLLSRLRAQGKVTFRFPKVHPAEFSREYLKTLGFRPVGGHLLYAARARSD